MTSREIIEKYKEILDKGKDIVLTVKVSTRMSRTRFTGQMEDGTLKMNVTSAPEKGKANKEIIKFLSKELGVPKNSIEIISGETSPKKMIKIRKE